jgi:hypothetical protein
MGLPAGKLTTAKALLRPVPGRSFHNRVHGAPWFWELIAGVRQPTGEKAVTRPDRRHLMMGLGAALTAVPSLTVRA